MPFDSREGVTDINILEKPVVGAEKLGNIRIVTMYWSLVDENPGGARETGLANVAFKLLIGASAVQCRCDDTAMMNARVIAAELVGKEPVVMQIQIELDEGKLVDSPQIGGGGRRDWGHATWQGCGRAMVPLFWCS
ncbi:hypothetical protein GALMADRAFT_215461 [Galerina marginata CBS 339.88]|uniref:Uncharacterized protein n=1 Tax=Galerina marginata (strain CBS 339.88) TaxID=685588 RepID=A0A067SD69_GALM3|nr:hypothetical protein GALMADRAFT_215461 [Galerina marginata CBS 339.88]